MNKYTIIFTFILLFVFNYSFSQDYDEKLVKKEILSEMDIFYNKMRSIDLSWMDILSDDATAVHNGEFVAHEEFLDSERNFFNSLSNLKIKVIIEPLIYVIGPNAACVSIRHSIDTTYKSGVEYKDIEQSLTFIWHKRNGKWYMVHAHFVTVGAINQ